MDEIIIKSLSEFEDLIEGLEGDWVFRGQSDAKWPLDSSLHRFFEEIETFIQKNNKNARDASEEGTLEEFRINAPHYLNRTPDDESKLEWLSIMQHYGAPTRLLDVTCSPYIALFFAIESRVSDASVFAIKPSHFSVLDECEYLTEANYLEFITDGLKDTLKVSLYAPTWGNERLTLQQGMFLVSNTLKKSMQNIIDGYGATRSNAFKIVIPSSLKMNATRKLIDMNLTSATLYPSLEGYSSSVRNLMLHYLNGAEADVRNMPNKWFQRTSLKLRR